MTDADMVAAFIAEKGVTRCPAAILTPCQAAISAADAAAHVERGIDPTGDNWRARHAKARKNGTKKRGGWAAYWARKRGGEQ